MQTLRKLCRPFRAMCSKLSATQGDALGYLSMPLRGEKLDTTCDKSYC